MRERTIPSVDDMELVGGRLCLDFVNTVNRMHGRRCDERFATFADVLRWSARLGLINRAAAARLGRSAVQFPDTAQGALQGIVALRECLWRLFTGRPGARDPGILQEALRGILPRVRRRQDKAGIVLDPGRDLSDWLLLAVSWSALELLTSSSLSRVKSCPGDRCNWLFLDASPNNRRKWCSMKTCGNRHKVREHYNRLRVDAS
ncbi:MAG: CGNR zinc finger domain-containing protein [Woeseiaceae bacterium]